MDRLLLENKVALITGGTNGIGRASAILFAREGAKVAFCGRNEERGREVVEEIEREGSEGLFFNIDVARMSDIRAMVDGTLEKFGRIDVIFSNAGIYGMRGSAVEITEEDWD